MGPIGKKGGCPGVGSPGGQIMALREGLFNRTCIQRGRCVGRQAVVLCVKCLPAELIGDDHVSPKDRK